MIEIKEGMPTQFPVADDAVHARLGDPASSELNQ